MCWKIQGKYHMRSRRILKIKSLISQNMCSSSCEDWCTKIKKLKIVYMKDYITQGDRISLNPCKSLEEGEGGQVSFSLVVIHTTWLRRCSLKLQTCYLRRRRGGQQKRQSKKPQPMNHQFLVYLTLMDPALLSIGSPSNYLSLVDQQFSIQ